MEETRKEGIKEFLRVLVISLLIVLPVRWFIAQPFIVDGASMEPNLQNGDYLIIDELSYRFHEPERGEIIVFRYPLNPTDHFIKRIIGLPGETVRIEKNSIIIGKDREGTRMVLHEAYIPESFKTVPDMTVTLGDGEYFVLGDNRSRSSDSRTWGVLPRGNMTGRAWVRLWPITHIGTMHSS